MLYREQDHHIFDQGRKLPLVEQFYTIQGEGFHMGKPAYFIRLGGCDIGCSWCDTKFSWNPAIHALTNVDEIVNRAADSQSGVAVVTGGEPLIYPLEYLTSALHLAGLATHLETSGAYALTGTWDWICLSPKRNSPPKKEIFKLAQELKVIVQTEADLEWAELNAGKVSEHCMLFLQPEWSACDNILPVIVSYIKSNTKWSISLQAHKFMKIP